MPDNVDGYPESMDEVRSARPTNLSTAQGWQDIQEVHGTWTLNPPGPSVNWTCIGLWLLYAAIVAVAAAVAINTLRGT